MADQQRLTRNLVEKLGLVAGVDRANRDSIHPFGEQVIHDLALFCRRTAARDVKIYVQVAELLGGILRTRAGDGPERGCTISHKSELELLGWSDRAGIRILAFFFFTAAG